MGAAMRQAREERREWGGLDPDLIVEVMSYLPPEGRIQAMAVNRNWEKAVREGNLLWREVKVQNARLLQKWYDNQGDRWATLGTITFFKSNYLSEVLQVAEEVCFGNLLRSNDVAVMSLEGAYGTNLRILELPGSCVLPSFFQGLPTDCPNLESLVVSNDPDLGPIQISHTKLKALEFRKLESHVLTIECVNLNVRRIGGILLLGKKTHSLNCPQLATLALSRGHCVAGGLESMASNAPNISMREPITFRALTDFRSLACLELMDCGENVLVESRHWPFDCRGEISRRLWRCNTVD